ncbi:exopolysaccharide biosynthesis protein [Seohaeicola zhoushanensis]|nr:exopolysaccharide biosynthesis protein [Seohaeicola zhoushanensis]
MQRENGARRRPSLSLPILRTSRSQHRDGSLTLGNLLSALGERSFGWAIVVFSLITLLPLPPGSTLVTALPLLVTTCQMALGYRHVRLPGPLARLKLDPGKLRRTVLSLRPITRRLERILTPRYLPLFARRNERLLGAALFVVAFALFLPIPLSGWFPAISLFVFGVGHVERDGLVAILGLALGATSVLLTAVVLTSLAAGAEAMIH